jgi:RNA polymerase sigma factor (sigma-70 family)
VSSGRISFTSRSRAVFAWLAGRPRLNHTWTVLRAECGPSRSTSPGGSAIAAVPSIGRAAHVERASRDADATQDLYERYSGQIFGYCVNQLGSRDEAEDALQSTFLNAHRALQRGVTPEAEVAWLFTIAHNVCLTRRRSTRRRGRVESPSDLAAVQDMLPAPSREAPDDLIGLPDALAHMPDNQRRAILLREWQGLSYREISDELNLSQSAVETLIFRARRTLASKLESERQQPSRLARARKAFDIGALLAALKGLLEGGAAVKVATVAVAASGAVVVATTPQAPLSKPAPQKPAVTPVVQAAKTAPLVLFQSAGTAAASVVKAKQPPAASAPKALTAAPAAAAALQRPKKQKANDEPRTTPPGQAKKEVAAEPKAHVKPVKAKQPKENGKRAIVEPQPAPVQPAAPAPVQPAAPAAEQTVSAPAPVEAPAPPEKGAKAAKK